MKLLALTLFLAVLQTAPPVPRKATDNATSSSKNIKQESGNQQTPSGPAIGRPQIHKRPGETPSDAHAQETIVIRESAPVPKAKKDGWDKAPAILTGILVIVGALGVRAAFRTLKAIENQAAVMTEQREVMLGQMRSMGEQITEMSVQSGILTESVAVARDAAEASKRNVALAINKERARIRIVRPEKLSLTVGSFATVEFKLLFYGTTPAYEVKSKVNCTISESLDSTESYLPHGIHELPTVVSASDIKPVYRDFLMKPLPLDDTTLDKINKFEIFVHFSGVIKYNDFVEEPRETAFHYRWNALADSPNSLRKLGFPEGWAEVGGEKENYYT